MYQTQPSLLPVQSVEEDLTGLVRRLGPPVPVITVTRGVDPHARRDPAALDDASPYFASSSESPRTP